MTFKELQKAVDNNSYIRLRTYTGQIIAINCKARGIMKKRYKFHPNTESVFIGFRPCSFQEYITHKVPYL